MLSRTAVRYCNLCHPRHYSTSNTRKQQQPARISQRNVHPEAIACGDNPKVIYEHGQKSTLKSTFRQFHELCNQWKLLRTADLGTLCGSRSYILQGPLAELEQGLVRYAIDKVMKTGKGYELITVPDLLYSKVIEGCGMETRGQRSQVYSIENPSEDSEEEGQASTNAAEHDNDICLAGTAEMSIAGYLANRIIPESQLPLRLIAVSRCYRAEVSTVEEEAGIFRVHNFTKVELFGVSKPELSESEALHNEMLSIQQDLFSSLGLHYQTLEMPVSDLSIAAYRKFDIEAWMPGRNIYGEISSTSNCIDNQAKKLNIRYQPTNDDPNKGEPRYVHTVNGTGMAIPRMLIALLETYQTTRGAIELPKVLDPCYINWKESLTKCPKYKTMFLKSVSQQEKVIQDSLVSSYFY